MSVPHKAPTIKLITRASDTLHIVKKACPRGRNSRNARYFDSEDEVSRVKGLSTVTSYPASLRSATACCQRLSMWRASLVAAHVKYVKDILRFNMKRMYLNWEGLYVLWEYQFTRVRRKSLNSQVKRALADTCIPENISKQRKKENFPARCKSISTHDDQNRRVTWISNALSPNKLRLCVCLKWSRSYRLAFPQFLQFHHTFSVHILHFALIAPILTDESFALNHRDKVYVAHSDLTLRFGFPREVASSD